MAFVMKTMMGHIEDVNDSFSKTLSSLRGILNVLDKKTIDSKDLQNSLDGLSVDSAQKYKKALKYAIDEVGDVCYTGVMKCKASVDEKTAAFHGFANNSGTYTSPKFEIKAKVFCIAPKTNDFDIGFMQDCTSKYCKAWYDDKSRQKLVASFRFPIGDSSNDSDWPFYYRGVSFQCTDPCMVALKDDAGTEYKLEMNDYFIKNGFRERAINGNYFVDNTKCTEFRRNQTFTCWLGRYQISTQKYKLWRECEYTLCTRITWNDKGLHKLSTDGTWLHGPYISAPWAKRPKVNAKVMNGAEFWRNKLKDGKSYV